MSKRQPCSCSHLQLPARVQVARQRNSLTPAEPLSRRVRLPIHHKRRALSTWRHAIQANAAGDIALPASSGHAESVRVPESGLLKSSWLKCRHDSEIFGLAIPALGSILLDPLLSLVDTGKLMVFGIVFVELRLYLNLQEHCNGMFASTDHSITVGDNAALVGRLGSAPLAAVGLSGSLFNFCNFLFSFLMVVTTPKVAGAVARKDLDKVAASDMLDTARVMPNTTACD